MPRRALIVGGSMAGLFAGLCLRQRGWQVEIFERSATSLRGRGAGITTHPQMRSALTDLGIQSELEFGVPVERRLVLDRSGTVIAQRTVPQISTSWNCLFDLLIASFGEGHYHRGSNVKAITQTSEGVIANLADGTSQSGDLLVAADGFRSGVRAQFLPAAQPSYAGYVAWRGLADERNLAGTMSPEVFASFIFCLPPGEQLLAYAVAGADNDVRPGHRRWNVVWYRPADELTALPRLLTDVTGRMHPFSIPPTLVAPAVVEEMLDDAAHLLPAEIATSLRLVDQPFLQPIYDLESSSLAFGRVALIGDAAMLARPHIGGAIVKAIEDAAALAAALDRHHDIANGLRAFEGERLPVGRACVAQARKLGGYFRDLEASIEERGAHALAETALMNFLQRS